MNAGTISSIYSLAIRDLPPQYVKPRVHIDTENDTANNIAPENIPSGKDKVEKSNTGIEPYSGLSEEEQREIEELKRRDLEVKAHEQAHIAAGGPYVRGGAHYEYQRGPDGKLYAVGGEVSIDVSPIPDNPEATIRKMQVVRRAALAPAQPSAQDYHIAAMASMEMQKARAELARMKATQAYGQASVMGTTQIRSSVTSQLFVIA